MTDPQFVFELQLKGQDDKYANKENQFVIIDGGSMADFSKLREDLSKCFPEPFGVQYIDDEDDIISIDSDEEFKEFSKFAKLRAARAMLIKLILNSNMPSDVNNKHVGSDNVVYEVQISDLIKNKELLKEVTSQLKTELKEEILSEMAAATLVGGYEKYEEFDDMVPVPTRQRHSSTRQKKDSRIEKLVTKKRKAHDKLCTSSTSKSDLKTRMDVDGVWRCLPRHIDLSEPQVHFACIMSGIAVIETCTMAKRVNVGKQVTHYWHIINDGTVSWQQVELRHTWSTPGLAPDMLSLPCPPLVVGEMGEIPVTFRVPMVVGAFKSYWHMYYQSDSQWVQFGHYVSVSGQTKMPKSFTTSDTGAIPKVKENTNEIKMFSNNIFNGEAGPSKKVQDIEECKILNKECNMTCAQKMEANQKRLEATLASAEIAAEMARVAANAALRAALGKQNNNGSSSEASYTPSPVGAVNIPSSVGMANIPTVANIPCSEGIANILCSVGVTNTASSVGAAVPSAAVNTIPPASDSNLTSSVDGNKKDEMAPKLSVLEVESANMVRNLDLGDDVSDDINIDVNEEDSEDSEFVMVGISGLQAVKKTMQPVHFEKPSGKASTEENVQGTVLKETDMEESGSVLTEALLSYPSVDPNINYPVFPPQPMPHALIMPPLPIHHHPSHGYPVFPAHNTISQPLGIHPNFQTYPQVPTYPPMPIPSHPPMPVQSHPPMPIPSHPPMPVQSHPPMPIPSHPPHVSIPSVGQIHEMNPSRPDEIRQRMMNHHKEMIEHHKDHMAFLRRRDQVRKIVREGISQSAQADPPNRERVTTRLIRQAENQSAQATLANGDTTTETAPQSEVKIKPSEEIPANVKSTESKSQSNSKASTNTQNNKDPIYKMIEMNLEDLARIAAAKKQSSSAGSPNTSTTETVHQNKETSVPFHEVQKRGESGIQILPQTLVDGAINVGATIYNKACNALNHLHLKDGESMEFDPVFENNMATLIEMGFGNIERNARLLKRCKNDINQVIAIICTTPGGNDLEID